MVRTSDTPAMWARVDSQPLLFLRGVSSTCPTPPQISTLERTSACCPQTYRMFRFGKGRGLTCEQTGTLTGLQGCRLCKPFFLLNRAPKRGLFVRHSVQQPMLNTDDRSRPTTRPFPSPYQLERRAHPSNHPRNRPEIGEILQYSTESSTTLPSTPNHVPVSPGVSTLSKRGSRQRRVPVCGGLRDKRRCSSSI